MRRKGKHDGGTKVKVKYKKSSVLKVVNKKRE